MGVSGKHQAVEGGLESEGKKWVIAGISLRPPLKPIYTTVDKDMISCGGGGVEGEEECSTTPTAEEARIPTVLSCPPAPRKRKPTFKCNYGRRSNSNSNTVREFFTPPDLDTVFIRHVERPN